MIRFTNSRLVVALLVILAISLIVVYKTFVLQTAREEEGKSPEETTALYIVKTINASSSAYTQTVAYPEFRDANKAFNGKIAALAISTSNDFKKNALENQQAIIDTAKPGEKPSEVGTPYSFFFNWAPEQINNRYVSILAHYGGYSGGAHGYDQMASFNYDIKNQRELALKDLLLNDPRTHLKIPPVRVAGSFAKAAGTTRRLVAIATAPKS